MRPSAFAIGIENGKTEQNIGTLWRSAYIFGASMIFTVGRRYHRQPSDTVGTPRSIPLVHFQDLDDLISHLPQGWPLYGVEIHMRATRLAALTHPLSCCYLLGSEDSGLSRAAIERAHRLVQLPGAISMNVASAGTVLMYDRHIKLGVAPMVERRFEEPRVAGSIPAPETAL